MIYDEGMGFPGSTVVKKSPANVGDAREGCLVLGWEDPLE